MKPSRRPRASRNGLAARFRTLRRRKQLALVAYVTAGDPNLGFTEKLVARLAAAGTDIVELGVPFSDPVADGPVIQRASQRALKAGATLRRVLELAQRIHRRTDVPLILFTYFNPVLQFGIKQFAARARRAGLAGVLITDLTPEEADGFVPAMRRACLDTVFLAAPTSTASRLRCIAKLSRGFVYLISRRGVTGAGASDLAEVRAQIKRLRRSTRLPIVVGFGIARPEQVAALDGAADGVVVGSALVECCERAGHGEAALTAAAELVARLKKAARSA